MWCLDEALCFERLGAQQTGMLAYMLKDITSFETSITNTAPITVSEKKKSDYILTHTPSELSSYHCHINFKKQNSNYLGDIKQVQSYFESNGFNAVAFSYHHGKSILLPQQSISSKINLKSKVQRTFHLLLDEPVTYQDEFLEFPKKCIENFKSNFDYDYSFTCKEEAKYFAMQSLIKELISEQLLYEFNSIANPKIKINSALYQSHQMHLNQIDFEEMSHSHKKASRDHCVFCDEIILEKQIFSEEANFTIIFNYLPYTWPHFMLIPKNHVENLFLCEDDLLAEVSAYLTEFVLKLERYYRKPFIIYNQNGSHAGQTQPHTHIHVLAKPDPLAFKIKIASMLHRVNTHYHFLSETEMFNARSALKNHLLSR